MTRLVVDPFFVAFRESCPQLDDLGHLQLSEVRSLTETHQVSSQILDLVPPSDPIWSNDCSLINQLINSNICEIKCHWIEIALDASYLSLVGQIVFTLQSSLRSVREL